MAEQRLRHLAKVAALLSVVAGMSGVTACEPSSNPPTTPGTARVVLYGDSIPAWLIGAGAADGIDRTKFTVLNGAVSACDGSLPFYDARWGTNEVVPVTPFCRQGWRKQYPPFLETRSDIALIMGGTHAMLDHKIDGVWVHPCRAAARSWYYEDLKARLSYLKVHSDRVVLVLPAWPGPNSRWIMPTDYLKRATCVREEMVRAASVRRVPTIDFGSYVCPTAQTVCESFRNDNGVHVDADDAADALRWVLESALSA
jgi:hypothetical protein